MSAKLLLPVLLALTLRAESGYDAWLRYARLDDAAALQYRDGVPAAVTVFGDSPVVATARQELIRGVRGMLGRTLRIEAQAPRENAIVLGTIADLRSPFQVVTTLPPDGFVLKTVRSGALRYTVIAGSNDRGVLYGAFALLRKMASGDPIVELDDRQAPAVPVRWVNQWDNLDGTIERGYGGRSIFWDKLAGREDLARVRDYGRLLASLGVNGCDISNVNANPLLLSPDFIPQIARIAEAFRPWGVRIGISVDFGGPKSIGGLATFDPLDPMVIAWWRTKADDLYRAIPDLGGFVLKADSEGRVGPSAYNRSHADAANVVARALAPHGGLFFYRGFIYDHHMDWTNPKLDRARAADDNFRALDGKFDDNVIIQIKHGPIDFQVREPASPLFGTLEKTRQGVELQVTQEYFGQSRHAVFLVPMWKEALDFDLRVRDAASPVKSRLNAFIGVANIGLDENWSGNHLSQANLYGFGRLAWNPDLSAKQIVDEWTRQTFGSDPKVLETVNTIQLSSWRTFENYTGPLGLQTLTDIVGNHYGVAIEASERNGWGQWHRADENGVGMDRTVATGTGYIGQYRPGAARIYESLATCPDELVLFLHHVPYTHKLHSGKTVIQYLYDSHYEGADAVEGYVRQWKTLRDRVDERRYQEILTQLAYQAGQAQVWRDAVNNWFHRTSGVGDAKGRVGKHPGRFEVEAMTLEGYTPVDVVPWEGGSGKAVSCPKADCSAAMKFDGQAGWYTVRVQYFDQNTGVAKYRVVVAEQVVDEWIAADRVPTRKIDSSSSTRRTISGIALRPGDQIRIEGIPDGAETAALDYLEILP